MSAVDSAGWSTVPGDIYSALESNEFDTVIGTINFNTEGDVGGDSAGFTVYDIVSGAYELLPY